MNPQRFISQCLLFGAFALTLLATDVRVDAQTPGLPDSLNANITGGFGALVYALAPQPDGKTLVAGNFTSVYGTPRSNIARLNADGTLDASFDPRPNGTIYTVAVQADGKVLIGGQFTSLQPNGASSTSCQHIARLHADGTVDLAFRPRVNDRINSIALQADGKILVGGPFTTLQPTGATGPLSRYFVARLESDGTQDDSFLPTPNFTVHSLLVQEDGGVLIGGQFETLRSTGSDTLFPRQGIARLTAGGMVDPDFDPNPKGTVFSMAVQADGRILLGGLFSSIQPNRTGLASSRSNLARVNADGTLDIAFRADPESWVQPCRAGQRRDSDRWQLSNKFVHAPHRLDPDELGRDSRHQLPRSQSQPQHPGNCTAS
jgi:uncharacterized delta-60 repeat protein